MPVHRRYARNSADGSEKPTSDLCDHLARTQMLERARATKIIDDIAEGDAPLRQRALQAARRHRELCRDEADLDTALPSLVRVEAACDGIANAQLNATGAPNQFACAAFAR